MGESGSQQRHEPGNTDDSELIQFGGLPARLPFGQIDLPRMPQLPPDMRVRATTALATLAAGLLIGFFGGRLTAHQAVPRPKSILPVSTPIVVPLGDAITMTGERCAVQVGSNLQLGLEIRNNTGRTIMLEAIRAMFPLGGLRAISSGVGTCGALPVEQLPPATLLWPSETEWVNITVAVRAGCPGALPVWFKVGYASAGKTRTATLAGFPDLGPVPYQHCRGSDQNTSAIIANVENGTNHSSRG
jgi:hypothetical protein